MAKYRKIETGEQNKIYKEAKERLKKEKDKRKSFYKVRMCLQNPSKLATVAEFEYFLWEDFMLYCFGKDEQGGKLDIGSKNLIKFLDIALDQPELPQELSEMYKKLYELYYSSKKVVNQTGKAKHTRSDISRDKPSDKQRKTSETKVQGLRMRSRITAPDSITQIFNDIKQKVAELPKDTKDKKAKTKLKSIINSIDKNIKTLEHSN